MKKKRLLLTLLTLLCFLGGARAQNQLTVYEGSDKSSYVPVYGMWADTQGSAAEFVIPSTELTFMVGGQISQLKFYITTPAAEAWTATFQVYLKEIAETTLTGITGPDACTVVYEGTLDATGSEMTVTFDTPYTYTGGNLLIGSCASVAGNYKTAYFTGTIQTENTAWYRQKASDAGSAAKFIPQTTFTYTGGTAPYNKPTNLTVSELKAKTATVSWTAPVGDVTGYTYQYGESEDPEEYWTTVENYTSTSVNLTGLSPETAYTFRVKAIYSGGESGWVTKNFTTPVLNPVPTALDITLTPGNGTVAQLSWTENGDATAWQICLNDDEENLIAANANPFTITGLTAETTYTAKVRAIGEGATYSAWSTAISFTPTNSLFFTVNEGTSTNSYVPVYGYYCDAGVSSQFIIPAADLATMIYGHVSKLTFYASQASVSWGTAEFKVYLGEVGETLFTDATPYDWGSLENVYEGTLSISGNKMEITFDNPYQYLGGNLLIGINQTETGTYYSSSWYGIATDENANPAIGGQTSGLSLMKFKPKTTIFYTEGTAPTVKKPTGLTVTYTGGTTAEVSWTSTESAFDIDVNGVVTENVTNPYTLTGLELATDYAVKVRAKKGNDKSDWTSPYNFTTDACTDPVIVKYSLHDSYGDGWGNAKIYILDEYDNVVDALTLTSGDTKEGTLKLCGSYFKFVWVGGDQFDYECSWEFTDADDNELFSATSGADYDDYDVLYEMDLNPCAKPTEFAASEITGKTAKLSWTENGTADTWQVCINGDMNNLLTVHSNPYTLQGLKVETDYTVKIRAYCDAEHQSVWSNEVSFTTDVLFPDPKNVTADNVTAKTAEISWDAYANPTSVDLRYVEGAYASGSLIYDNDTWKTNIGSGTSGTRTWGVMYPGKKVLGDRLTKVSFYETSTYATADITINVYSGGDDAPGTLLYTETVTPAAANDFHEVTLETPLAITPGENLWITLTEDGTYVMPACEVNDPNNRWIYSNGSWAALNSSLAQYGWMIRAEYSSSNDPASAPWETVNGATSPHTLTGLTPETLYTVQVKANYEGGNSNWVTTGFKTQEYNMVPEDVTVEPSASTATVSWTGGSDSYNVRYRTPVEDGAATFFDDFENGLGDWTIYTDGEYVSGKEGWYTINPTSGLSFAAHSDTYAASSWSWNNVAYNADNWLITPQVELGGKLKFWVRTLGSYPDSYEVLLSTASNDEGDFDVTLQAMAPAPTTDNWERVEIDLSNYAGQQGYIAIHHVDYDMNYLLIDDFGIYEADIPAGDWTTVEGITETNTTLTGLTPDTNYEVEVQGVGGVNPTEWSDAVPFTTLDYVTLTMNSNGIMTYAYDAPLDFGAVAGLTAYAATAITESDLTMTEINVAHAGAGLMLKGDPGTYTVSVTSDAADAALENNKLVGVLAPTAVTANYVYILANGSQGINWYPLDPTDNIIGANKAYLQLTKAEEDAISTGARGLNMIFDDGTSTAINLINSGAQNNENGMWYTLQGLRLDKKPTTKGIYIHNGKKVVIK